MPSLGPRLSLLSFSLITIYSSSIYAEFKPGALPLMPRVFGEGYFGNRALGVIDGMLPVFGSQDGIFYVDGLGKGGSDDGYLWSAGGGFRGIQNNSFLWGAYAFGDYNRTSRGQHFTVVNPGVEAMTNYWDVHVNGYFPTSKQKSEGLFLGTQLGTTQYISFTGHSQFDSIVNVVEEVGNGVDGEVGLTLPQLRYLRLFGGGYHFAPQHVSDINGVVGGVEVPINNNLTVSVRDSYDRVQKNTALFTVRFTLGGINKGEQPNIHDRLLDPIPRHLGTWDTGSGIPSQQAYINTGVRVLTRDNIWFFSGSGASFAAASGFGNCTFENPCLSSSFNQATLDSINTISPNANLYLGPGNYNNLGGASFVHSNAMATSLLTINGQSLYGRNIDFTASQPQILQGSLLITGGGTDAQGRPLTETIDSLILTNQNGFHPAGLVISGSRVNITNTTVGFDTNRRGYRTAVSIEGASDISIANSVLIGFADANDGSDARATGVSIENSFNINLLNNTILVDATQRTSNSVEARGILVDRGTKVTIQNRQLDVQAHNVGEGNGTSTLAQGVVVVNSKSGDFFNNPTITKSLESPITDQVVGALRALHSLLREPNDVTLNPSRTAAFSVKAENTGGSINTVQAQGINMDNSRVFVRYGNSTGAVPQDIISVNAENNGGTGNKVIAQGMFLNNTLVVSDGAFLNVTGLDNQGSNGSVTSSGYQAQGTAVFSSIVNTGGGFNVVEANSSNSNASLDAVGILLQPITSRTVLFLNTGLFRVTENGVPVTPVISNNG
ncbi:inverse autotransporter beta domain-containing protein [Legionella hackeliae]|uniref:Inverse autotransporter beta-domain domain-containing protein n=1 Tax=Legionella hackeliae TaxID=449 RepID=A0A0A8UVA0_LEGHA|nr:inverse autotransporter beta-barrel domain-containing protein [Legionella hackeliae]KTD11478.1 hypothetical protein Lhac_1874 [Legionella hackeliae]CEK10689.1 exported protein of unknown function [Legionella hackeliae]STX47436.1 Protein of uncharacterised function (DUF3442) [Legionella hackeliae]